MTPITIEGMPCNVSILNFVYSAILFFGFSAKKIPVKIPNGIDNAHATHTKSKLPTIALETPPPTSPTGLGSCVKNSRLNALNPLLVM